MMKTTVWLMIFHNHKPIELLFRIGGTDEMQVWHVRPIFVEGPERDVTIYASDVCSRIHGHTTL